MATRQFTCGLEFSAVPDLKNAIEITKNNKFDYVIVPMFHPGLERNVPLKNPERPLTRSCLALACSDWSQQVVGKISGNINVDSSNEIIRKRSERLLLQELSYASYVTLPAVIVPLRSGNCVNLARIVSSLLVKYHDLKVWVQVPLANPGEACAAYRSDQPTTEHEYESPWEWWNKFRLLCDSHRRLGVVLEVSADLPTDCDRVRWLAEPVHALILPTSLFITNRKGYPVLSPAHQTYITSFSSLETQFIICGPKRHDSLVYYAKYLEYVWNRGPTGSDFDPANRGFEDFLQCPLQPLMHNLDAQTYEVFEKDPVKYKVYKDAISSALVDRVSDEKKNDIETVIMVMGAGRGPLVKCALLAAEEVDRKVRVFAVEKNPNAVITLLCRKQNEWGKKVTVLSGDMRHLELEEKADIIVSELLGSFGDNELSPECLDGAQKFLKDDGISIPESYTSYVCPVMSQKLHTDARFGYVEPGKPQSATLETLYVVLQRNKFFLDKEQPLFTFRHPNRDNPIDNTRYEARNFTAADNCLLHGFSGFFDTVLYKSHILSIAPDNFSVGMFSWFPIFMPIQRPVQVRTGDTITAHFWRCVGENNVWYEWTITSPESLPLHNVNGRSCKIGL